MLTARHLNIAAKVPVAAQVHLRALRDEFPTRDSQHYKPERFAEIKAHLLSLGIELRKAPGVEKTWILFGDGFVIKVGLGGLRGGSCAVALECQISSDNPKRRSLAAAVLLDKGIEVQERAVCTLDEYTRQYHEMKITAEQLDKIDRRAMRVRRVLQRIGIGDLHGQNLAVFTDGSVKAIDYSL